MDQFNSNPSLELAENLMFDLSSEVKLIFDVEIISPNDIQNIDKLEITDDKISEALYTFEASADNQLSFNEGDEILKLESKPVGGKYKLVTDEPSL